MALREYPETGDRVRIITNVIEDIPRGWQGTVVGRTKPEGGEIIVAFDNKPSVRYMRKSQLDAALP